MQKILIALAVILSVAYLIKSFKAQYKKSANKKCGGCE